MVGHGDGESWAIYTIVPRAHLLRAARRLRRAGWKIESLLELLPENGPAAPRCYHYGGPGRGFNRATGLFHKSRRFYVFYVSGGLDI